jgi:hypothetical protein
VVVAYTPFDQSVAIEDGRSARSSIRTLVKQAFRSMFRRELRDMPAEIVSGSCSLFCRVIL